MHLKLSTISTELLVREKLKQTILYSSTEEYLHSCILNKFINCIMFSGKRSIAEKLILNSFLKLRNYLISNVNQNTLIHFNTDPCTVFKYAVRNIIPIIGLKNNRGRHKTTYTISYMAEYRRIRLALRWLRDATLVQNMVKKAFGKKGKKDKNDLTLRSSFTSLKKPKFADILAVELLKASLGLGKAILKKTELHKRVYAQRAYLKVKF